MLKDYLNQSETISGTYIGFESNSFCYSPTKPNNNIFTDLRKDTYKCARS